MSTPSNCRREEVAYCQPDRTILVDKKSAAASSALESGAPEKATMSEKQFLRDHSLYSAMSSWLFAIAGATNIGVLGVVSAKILQAAEQGRPLFKSNDPAIKPVMGNKKYNYISLAMVGFGGVCMAFSNWLESKKVVTEWQLGAGKMMRKMNIAENKAEQGDVAAASMQPAADAAPASSKSWADSVAENKLTEAKVRG